MNMEKDGNGPVSWLGTWRNQYGSILEITEDSNNQIFGKFRTALPDSGFYGQELEVVGVHHGACIGLAAGGAGTTGDMVVTYTGLLREGRLETLWYVVSDTALTAPREGARAEARKLNWWRAVTTNADTFERIEVE